MDIDLNLLHSNSTEEIDITNKYTIPKEYFENSEVVEIKDIDVVGKIYSSPSDEKYEELVDYIKCSINGTIKIEDSITLDPIDFEISVEYDDILDENCKKNENTLDIFQFLWENIVLEVPLKFTKVKDLSKFHGDGWKLISEDEKTNANNPFNDLLKSFKEE